MADSYEVFIKNFQKRMSQEGAPSQTELGRALGVTSAYIHNILKGRSVGTEATRRAIAAALGVSYEDMSGLEPLTCVRLWEFTCPRIRFSDMLGEDAAAAIGMGDAEAIAVPIVPIESARSLRVRVVAEAFARWVTVVSVGVPVGGRLIALEMPDDSLEPAIALGALLVVDVEQREVSAGAFYLCDEPTAFPVQQVYNEKGLIIVTGTKILDRPPEVYNADDADFIRGKVVGICDENAKQKGVIFYNSNIKK